MVERKQISQEHNRLGVTDLKLNDIFEFNGSSYKISHLSEVGVRAEKLNSEPCKTNPRTLYWFGVEHFEEETGLKINTKEGFPIPIEPYRYVVSPEGFGEIVEVNDEQVKVRLFNSKEQKGRRKITIVSREQLRSLSQYDQRLSNAGVYIKCIERIVIPYAEETETQASIEVVQDTQDGEWRYGIEFLLPNSHGGSYSPSKFQSKTFGNRGKAIKAAAKEIKALMKEDLQRAETTSDQQRKLNTAIKLTDEWLRTQGFESKATH